MSKIAIVYWSGTGNTESMAECIEAGAKDGGAEVTKIKVESADAFKPEQVKDFDVIAFGCSSQGSEQLQEDDFEPMFAALEGSLSGKKVALFGSYGWGDGQWMRDWAERCKTAGANMFSDGLICNEAPNDDQKEECSEVGKELARW